MSNRAAISQDEWPEAFRRWGRRIGAWLRVPDLPGENTQIHAGLVHHALLSLLGISMTVAVGMAFLSPPGGAVRLLVPPLVILASAPLVLLLLHRGRPRMAAWTLLLTLWALIFSRSLSVGGTLAPILGLGYLLVVFAALTLGRWASLGVLGLVLLGHVSLVGLGAAGWIPEPTFEHTAWTRTISTAAIGAALVAILWRSGADAERVLEARAETQRELERQVAQRTRELQASHTALSAAHAVVEAMNRDLEATILEQTESLRAALHQAEAAAEAKSLFLARMGHELRTPLNQIMLLLQLIESAWPGEPDPETADDFARIQASGRHLESLIQDVLLYCDLSAGKVALDRQPLDVGRVCEDVIEACRPSAEAKGLKVRVDVDRALPALHLGDEARLRQVLREVASNAVKFTDHGEVRLRVGQATGREGLAFEVEDTGTGVAGDRLDRLFEPFEQADGTLRRRHGGTGLGLALVKHLVDLMGGEVCIDSTPGAGTRVRMEIALPPA